MMHRTTIGGENDGKGKPIKTFNEQYEIRLRIAISSCLDREIRQDGEMAYVVKDLGELILTILEFYEKKGIKS